MSNLSIVELQVYFAGYVAFLILAHLVPPFNREMRRLWREEPVRCAMFLVIAPSVIPFCAAVFIALDAVLVHR